VVTHSDSLICMGHTTTSLVLYKISLSLVFISMRKRNLARSFGTAWDGHDYAETNDIVWEDDLFLAGS
jgi:hypothetical protein